MTLPVDSYLLPISYCIKLYLNRALVRGGDRGDKSPPEFFRPKPKFRTEIRE